MFCGGFGDSLSTEKSRKRTKSRKKTPESMSGWGGKGRCGKSGLSCG